MLNLDSVDVIKNLGSLFEDMFLEFCIRVLCRRFLLGGIKDKLIFDRVVRVSIKFFVFGCVSYIMMIRLYILFMNVFKEVNEGNL